MNCNDCKKVLKRYNINDLKSFRRWALRGHPDKGGDVEIFKEVSNCNDDFFGINKKCYWTDSPKKPSPRKPPSPKKPSPRKPSPRKPSPKKPCRPNQYRHPETKRCRKKPTSPKSKPCRPDQYRHPETKRCRKKPSEKKKKSKSPKSKKSKSPKKKRCPNGSKRNKKTGECEKK